MCKKVVALAKDFSPANKAHLLTLFCGGCSQMSRVTRWIAYYLISKNEFDAQVSLVAFSHRTITDPDRRLTTSFHHYYHLST